MRPILSIIAVLCSLASAQQPNPDELLKAAIDAQQRGDFQNAITAYRRVLELRPNNAEAEVNLGAALVHEGRFDEGIAMYRAALPAVPQKNPVLLNIALAYYKKGDFEKARAELEPLQKEQPNSVRIAVLLGDSYNRLLRPADTIALLEPLEKANPGNLDLEYILGNAMIGGNRRRDGVERVERVAKAGHSAEAYLLAGTTLMQLNEYDQARADLDEAIRLNPNLPGVYTLAGSARDKAGDVKEAEAAFRESLKRNADDFYANLYLGAILYKRRDVGPAKPYLEKALSLQPSSTLARYEMAMLKSAAGDYEGEGRGLEDGSKDDPKLLDQHGQHATL